MLFLRYSLKNQLNKTLRIIFAEKIDKLYYVYYNTVVTHNTVNTESEAQYEELHNFVREAQFDRLGCFTYSAEEGTIAAEYSDQLDEQTKQDRAEHIMETQLDIASAKNEQKIGTVQTVLIEGWDDYIKCYYGRSEADAPEIDGKVFFMAKQPLVIGDFVKVQINDVIEYDLLGEQL